MVNFIVWIVFIPLEIKTSLNHIKNVYCNAIWRYLPTTLLEINQNKKSNNAPPIIYADLKCMIERIDGYKK